MRPDVVALDPGATTGVALYWREERRVETTEVDDLAELWNCLNQWQPSLIVYESFHWQQRHGVDFRPIEVIGIIKLWASAYLDVASLVAQSPSQGKAFWSDDKLKRAGVYSVGSPHKRDATRHLLHYLTFTEGDKSWLQLLKKPAATHVHVEPLK